MYINTFFTNLTFVFNIVFFLLKLKKISCDSLMVKILRCGRKDSSSILGYGTGFFCQMNSLVKITETIQINKKKNSMEFFFDTLSLNTNDLLENFFHSKHIKKKMFLNKIRKNTLRFVKKKFKDWYVSW